jgi:hypothetical protein
MRHSPSVDGGLEEPLQIRACRIAQCIPYRGTENSPLVQISNNPPSKSDPCSTRTSATPHFWSAVRLSPWALNSKNARMFGEFIMLIEDEFGDLPIAALADRRVRGEFKSCRDRYANTPRKADFAWTAPAYTEVLQSGSRAVAAGSHHGGAKRYGARGIRLRREPRLGRLARSETSLEVC